VAAHLAIALSELALLQAFAWSLDAIGVSPVMNSPSGWWKLTVEY
jgi:hypothetical protein